MTVHTQYPEGTGPNDPEVWLKIVMFPNYEVSDKGNVRSINGKILKPGKDTQGYLRIEFTSDRTQRKFYYIHHLVAETFIRPQKMEDDL